MSVTRFRWLTVVGLALGLPMLALAQQPIAVSRGPIAAASPRVIAASSVAAAPASEVQQVSYVPSATATPVAAVPQSTPTVTLMAPVAVTRPAHSLSTQTHSISSTATPTPLAVAPEMFVPAPSRQVIIRGRSLDTADYPPPPSMATIEDPLLSSDPPRFTDRGYRSAGVRPASHAAMPAGRNVTRHDVAANPPEPGSLEPTITSGVISPTPSDMTPGAMTDIPLTGEASGGSCEGGSKCGSCWDKLKNCFGCGDKNSWGGGGGGGWGNERYSFQSDRDFRGMISPVSMPFYSEDPRALTELRPIFMWQAIPGGLPTIAGGNAYFFGTQARLAFNERISLVISELGFLSLQPKVFEPPIQSGWGFAELKLGPKWTFYRNPDNGTCLALGTTFELPIGSNKVRQNTGTLSIDPYFSYAQSLPSIPGGYGGLNLMGTTGYSFSADDRRSEFFYSTFHLDWNIAGTNAFFPFVEMNWIHYTQPGNATNLGREGADLVNFGSETRRARDYFTIAPGLRYRFSDNFFVGGAFEIPLSKEKGISDYRLTLDCIIRY